MFIRFVQIFDRNHLRLIINLIQLSSLKLISTGNQQERKINGIAVCNNSVFTTCGPYINRWSGGHLTETYKGHLGQVYLLLTFGDLLLSISKDRTMNIWTIKEQVGFSDRSLYGSISFGEKFTPSFIIHPHTYLNKVLVASEEGSMQLWNIKNKKLIYEFSSFGSPITCMEQSPALDVIGIGLQDGRIIIKNIKLDKTIVQFLHSEGGPITSLSFRADKKYPILATGNYTGQVAIWDLEKKKLSTIMKSVHDGPISSLKFVPNEPLLVSTGHDNALRIWIFDRTDGSGRILRFRSGHYDTPSCIRFYKSNHDILSSGEDKTFRVFNIVRETLNRELVQGKLAAKAKKREIKIEDLKVPVITSFATSTTREKDWDNIVTIHRDSSYSYTWSWQGKSMGKHRFSSTKNKISRKIQVTSACISQCGNYSFIGTSKGEVCKFNLQSGMPRGSNTKEEKNLHLESVTGVVTDLLNIYVISGSLDCTIKFWCFKSLSLKHTIEVESPITRLELQRESNLLVVISDDLVIRLYDIDTKKLVRRFSGHTNQITDITFSNDSRWLISSSLDCTIRVWDIITGRMIDWFRTQTPVISLDFSPGGEFLATAQLGSVGIFLWSNKNYYSSVFLEPPPSEPPIIALPIVSKIDTITETDQLSSDSENDSDDSDSEMVDHDDDSNSNSNDDSDNDEPKRKKMKLSNADDDDENDKEESFPLKLSDNLVTLSSLPRERIKTIVNLELIKERNKPTEAPSAPKLAPFILPSSTGVQPNLLPLENEVKQSSAESGSRILNFGKMNTKSKFLTLLESKENYVEALTLLNQMTPSAVDLEIRQLTFIPDILLVFDFIKFALTEHLCFELIQALLNIVLKMHANEIFSNEELLNQASEIRELQENLWDSLENMFHYNQCLISHLSGLQI